LEVACVAGGFVGERARAVKPRGEWARGKSHSPCGFAARARSPTKRPVTQAIVEEGEEEKVKEEEEEEGRPIWAITFTAQNR